MVSFLMVLFTLFHPFHVSVCEIEFNEKEKRAEVTIKIFLDDMENGLRKMTNEKIDIVKIAGRERDSLVGAYLNQHFFLKIDQTNSKGKFLGSEIEKDALWCYYELDGVKKFSQIMIRNTILYEIFDDQVNLINVSLHGEIKSARLNASNPSEIISF
ncbi:MAG TPA: DUF6702 family protein [Cytophagales bacterium]|nr:DUF6702 family protein [Cytophagales bacterium]